jgi:hypothetical protein
MGRRKELTMPSKDQAWALMISRILSCSVAWLLWAAMLLADAYYVLTAMQTKPPAHEAFTGDWKFPSLLLVMSVAIIGWTFLVRWLYKKLLSRKVPLDSIASHILLPATGLLIWVPCGAVAIYGLIAFFSTRNLVWFFAFITISCALLIVHMPYFLAPKHGSNVKPNDA